MEKFILESSRVTPVGEGPNLYPKSMIINLERNGYKTKRLVLINKGLVMITCIMKENVYVI